MMEEVIQLKNVTRSFVQGDSSIQILKGITFTVTKGEFISIIGSSGSGKSTLLQILGLLDTLTTGSYFLGGHDVSHLDDDTLSHMRNQFIGFVFQNFYLIPYATALENVMLPGMYTTQHTKDMKERAQALLERVGLADRMQFKPSMLSGGQQQRIALARALFNEPAVLLADEPTGQLDSKTSVEILDLFSEINQDGTTVIVVTHAPETARTAKRTIVVKDGVILSDGPTQKE